MVGTKIKRKIKYPGHNQTKIINQTNVLHTEDEKPHTQTTRLDNILVSKIIPSIMYVIREFLYRDTCMSKKYHGF